LDCGASQLAVVRWEPCASLIAAAACGIIGFWFPPVWAGLLVFAALWVLAGDTLGGPLWFVANLLERSRGMQDLTLTANESS
jgi:hypothetical protein